MASYSVPSFQWSFQAQPAAGGSLNVYQTGTTTPVTIYSDGGLTTPISNPLTLDSNGMSLFYVGGTVALKLVAFTATGTLIETIDPVYPVPNLSGFTGTGTDLQKIAGVTNGTAMANAALVTDSNVNVTGLFTNTYNTASTQIANMQAVQGSMTGGFVNKFRNASFDVWQRGNSGTITAGTPAYSADGWILSSTGANISWAQLAGHNTGTLPFYGLELVGAASVSDTYIKQRIESYIAASLAGQQVTVQLQVFNNTGASFTPTLTVKRPTAQDNYSSTATDINAVNLSACPNTTLTNLSYTFAANALSYNGLEITFDFGGVLSTNLKNIIVCAADIRATPGIISGINTNPPVIEYRPVSYEMKDALRYFWSTFPLGTIPAQGAGATGAIYIISSNTTGNVPMALINFGQRMRAIPSLTYYNTVASNALWRDVTAGTDKATTPLNINDYGFGLAVGATTSVGDNLYIHVTASAEL